MNSNPFKQTDLNHKGSVFLCERCGQKMRPEHAHDICDFCGWSSHCCEGDVCNFIDSSSDDQMLSSPISESKPESERK